MCLKNRVEINAGNSERSDIIELFFDSSEVSAEIIVVEYLTVSIGFPFGLCTPVFTQYSVIGYAVERNIRAIESVGKNLIYHAAFISVGCCEIF